MSLVHPLTRASRFPYSWTSLRSMLPTFSQTIISSSRIVASARERLTRFRLGLVDSPLYEGRWYSLLRVRARNGYHRASKDSTLGKSFMWICRLRWSACMRSFSVLVHISTARINSRRCHRHVKLSTTFQNHPLLSLPADRKARNRESESSLILGTYLMNRRIAQIRPGQIYWQSVMEPMGPTLKPVVGRRPQSLDKILRKLGCEFWVSNSSTQLFIFKRARGANFCIPTNTSVYRRGRRLCVIVCPLSLPIKIQPRGYKYRIRHQERTRTSLLLVAVLPWLTLWTPLPSIA